MLVANHLVEVILVMDSDNGDVIRDAAVKKSSLCQLPTHSVDYDKELQV